MEEGMHCIETPLKGAFILKPRLFRDQRGYFSETYNRKAFEQLGFSYDFVQDNHSFSKGIGVIRGLHFQKPPYAQTKLVWVVKGRIFDVVVDLRRASQTHGKWFDIELSAFEMNMILVPKGFAHGFCTMEEDTVVLYKVDAYYVPDADSGIRWDDPNLSIPWPVPGPILSEKDKQLPFFREIGLIF
jgi:dTDP-4-dehydrorhamnose 3,5-epimerase